MNKQALEMMKQVITAVYKEKSRKIGEFEITLKNLSAKEEAEVYVAVGNLKGTEFFHVLKVQTLAKSMVAIKKDGVEQRFEIDGVKIDKEMTDEERDQYLSDVGKREKEILNEKMSILILWPATVIDELYKVYSDLSNEIDKELGFDKKEDESDEPEMKAAETIQAMNAIAGE